VEELKMELKKTVLILLVLGMAMMPGLTLAREAREQARIDFLIHEVEIARGITFIRNGSEYNGTEGAKHLRMKLGFAGERVKTAEDFVKYCASESSMSHRKYQVRTTDGKTTDAASYFYAKLREFDEKH
jgi:Family of unknown function (DUF5329)